MNPLRRYIAERRRAARNALSLRYGQFGDKTADRHRVQLDLLNAQWAEIQRYVPYYRERVRRGETPKSFDSWEEFSATVPPLTRDTVRELGSALHDERRAPDFYRMTGGSTSQPVQMPAWRSEHAFTEPEIWRGRHAYGIEPEDSLFLLWGHSHLLGSGIKGWLNARKREWQDRVLGYTNVSAYDLTESAMHRAAELFRQSGADYVIGYSVALDRFRCANAGAPLGHTHKLKAVIGTAEAFPSPDAIAGLEALFKAPVGMEYGTNETNQIAHTHPEGDYKVFWRAYGLEAVDASPAGGYVARVTSLYRRCFPLLRYELGDEIVTAAPGHGLAAFERVLGRTHDYIRLPSGECIHSMAITHAVREHAAVSGYQLVQHDDRTTLRVTTTGGFERADQEAVRRKLASVDPALSGVHIDIVDRLEQTRAGKTPMVIHA